jgi:ATP-dependent helicase/nuclease subunit B
LEEALPQEWLQAWAALYQKPKTQPEAMQIVSALNDTLNTKPLERETALKLFGHETMSVSRLEEYAQCPYKHFVHYGLRPVERKEWTLTSADVGTYFHSALKDFTERPQHMKPGRKSTGQNAIG